METTAFLAFLTGLAATYVVAAPSSAPDASYPRGIVLNDYPNEPPAELKSRAELIPRAMGLEKRDPVISPNATLINVSASQDVRVFACSDPNFDGNCVVINSAPGQCVSAPPGVGNPSSVGTASGLKCRFYVNSGCDPEGGSLNVQGQGVADLQETSFNNLISSYRCEDIPIPPVSEIPSNGGIPSGSRIPSGSTNPPNSRIPSDNEFSSDSEKKIPNFGIPPESGIIPSGSGFESEKAIPNLGLATDNGPFSNDPTPSNSGIPPGSGFESEKAIPNSGLPTDNGPFSNSPFP